MSRLRLQLYNANAHDIEISGWKTFELFVRRYGVDLTSWETAKADCRPQTKFKLNIWETEISNELNIMAG